MRQWAIACGLAALSSAAAADYVVDAAHMATVELARVRAPRAYVLHGYGAGCPERGVACRSGAYLVAGDPVLRVGKVREFVQVRYSDARGRETVGLLPASDVARLGSLTSPGWVGHWVRSEATIDIKAMGQAGFAVSGDATWGAGDPERVRRGGVNIGGFEGTLGLFHTRPDETGVVAVRETGDDPGSCRVWVRLLGPYLLVTDNNECGGNNVSFTGTYRRAR